MALAFAAWAAGTNVAAAGPWFVAPAGNDANDCQTFATACQTIGAAVGKASAGDTVIVASGIYTEGVTLNKNLTLIGFGADATIISGADINYGLLILSGVRADVYDLAVVHGFNGIGNHGVLTLTNVVVSNSENGISNEGQLTVNYSSIHDNHSFYCGGIDNYQGTASVNHSMIMSNSVNELGGGICNDGGSLDQQIGGYLTVNDSIIANNIACNATCPFSASRRPRGNAPDNGYGSEGGGIYSSDGALTITNSTISGNIVMFGIAAGLAIDSPATISNTTISGNMAGSSAGILNNSVLTLTNVTLSDNVNDNLENAGSLWMRNTIVNNGGCTFNAVVSLGHNLDSGNSCALNATGDLTSTNPLLGPLQDNGGPTPTHALLAGSPAINHGDNAGCPATDQRGVARPQAGVCDIGAYEYVFPYATFLPSVRR